MITSDLKTTDLRIPGIKLVDFNSYKSTFYLNQNF